MRLLDFKELLEQWNEYECEDGTRIKLKVILTAVRRDEIKPNEFGEPTYNLAWIVAFKVLPPRPRVEVS